MTRLKKLERDFAKADIAAVNGLLAQLSDEDVMTRFGLEARLEELQHDVEALAGFDDEATASAALFFGGQPVLGSRGIESEFGGTAIAKFQDLVAKVLAYENGQLGQRGVVPNRSASTLHITNIVRGSFGFLLEEAHPQQHLIDTSLKTAVDEATRLLDAFGEPDEEAFRTAVEEIDERVLGTAREFFGLMRQRGATLRIVAGDRDNSFGAEAVARAADRATSTVVRDGKEIVAGQLAGVLPDAHQFEFRASGEGRTLRGKVDRSLTAEQLSQFNRDYVNVDGRASFNVKRVLRNDVVVRETYTLTSLEAVEPN